MSRSLLISNSRASYYTGGTEVVSMHQATGLAKIGHHITYVVRSADRESEYFQDFERTIAKERLPISVAKVAVRAPYGNGYSWDIWNEEAAAFGAAAQPEYERVVKEGVDLLVTHMSADALHLPENVPQVLHLHGSPKSPDSLIDESMTRPDSAIAHSTSIRDWWSSHYPNVPMDIFRNGVPVETFLHPPDAPRPIDILYVGRFLEHKGILDIITAATPDQNIVLAGSGAQREEVIDAIKARGVRAKIIDSPSNEALVKLYKQAKVFACPSRSKEGVLTTMLEASAAGCAIVTSEGSGMTDLAVDHQNSRLIQPGDVESLKGIFQELLADPEQRLKLAKTMQQTIRSEWSWEAKATQLEEIYEKACTNR